MRSNGLDIPFADEYIQVGDIDEKTDWLQALKDADMVIHLAARVHIMNDKAANPLQAFRQTNVQGTEHLARMAAKSGVKRFIFVSSVKVNGEGADKPYTEKDLPQPEDDYGVSKQEAEEVLSVVAAETALKIVILRPSLVYGPGVKANFKNLIKIVGLGVPLPLKGIRNQRSFLYVGNLVDAITICITHPLAVGETFLLSDGEDFSTPDLMKLIASAMNKRVILFSLPAAILKTLLTIVGQGDAMGKLEGSLCVDSSKIRDLLGWKPPFTIKEGISRTLNINL